MEMRSGPNLGKYWATDWDCYLAVHLGKHLETQMALHLAEHWVQH